MSLHVFEIFLNLGHFEHLHKLCNKSLPTPLLVTIHHLAVSPILGFKAYPEPQHRSLSPPFQYLPFHSSRTKINEKQTETMYTFRRIFHAKRQRRRLLESSSPSSGPVLPRGTIFPRYFPVHTLNSKPWRQGCMVQRAQPYCCDECIDVVTILPSCHGILRWSGRAIRVWAVRKIELCGMQTMRRCGDALIRV